MNPSAPGQSTVVSQSTLIDLSQPIFAQCPQSPTDPPVESKPIASYEKEGWHVEEWRLTSQSGSHIDAPRLRFKEGATIDQLPLSHFTGAAVIADLRDSRPEQPFTSSWLTRKLRTELAGRIVLLATGWGSKRAPSDEWLHRAPYVSPDGAEWLVEQEIRGVGIDHHSIGGSRPEQNRLAHEILLGAGIWIVEDLILPEELFTLPQPMEYWGLPINFKGSSGSLCRPVILRR